MSISTQSVSGETKPFRSGMDRKGIDELTAKLKRAGYDLDLNDMGSHGICHVYKDGCAVACIYGNCISPVGTYRCQEEIRKIAESI